VQIAPPLFEVEVPRSDGGENVEKSKDERSKIKVESDGATEILHSVQDKYRLSRNLVWISI
jgi:hypothetical protein